MTQLIELMKPIRIGSMEIGNRIVMPAMGTRLGSDTGSVTERLLNYYSERAKGGVGLMIVEATCIESQLGRHAPTVLCIDNDRQIPGLNE